MARQYDPDFVPSNRNQALSLLRAVDDVVERLTVRQVRAIRALYSLDDDRTVEERCRTGELLTHFSSEARVPVSAGVRS
jgi:hypothetical protein